MIKGSNAIGLNVIANNIIQRKKKMLYSLFTSLIDTYSFFNV